MSKTEARCPLCGARITATHLLDTCSGIHDLELGVLACTCPHCQGRLEIRPVPGELELGYIFGKSEPRFDVAGALALEGLSAERGGPDGETILVRTPSRVWEFRE